MRRVAITGLGIVSPVGTGQDAFFASLLAPRSGIRSIEVAFPTGAENVLAGRIDFDADKHFSKARLMTLDRVSQFALVAAREAMAQAGLTDPGAWGDLSHERFGVSVGTGTGGAGSIDAVITPCWSRRFYVCGP